MSIFTPDLPACRRCLRLGLILLVGWLGAALALPAPAMAAEIAIATGSGNANAPVIAAAPGRGGRFFVVWFETAPTTLLSSGKFDRVMARGVDAQGNVIGGDSVVSQGVTQDQSLGGSRPAIAYNSIANEFLVVYDRTYDGSTRNGIFAQRVGASGTLIGSEITVVAAPFQRVANAAYDPSNNRYFVVWSSPTGIGGTFVSSDGQATTAIQAYGPPGANNPILAFSPTSNRYFLAYQFPTPSTDLPRVVGVPIGADGAALKAGSFLSSANAAAVLPSLAWDSTLDRFAAVWSDFRDSAILPAAYAQLVDTSGNLVGSNLKLAAATLSPRIIYGAAAKRYLLTWQVGDATASRFAYIQGRVFDAGLAGSGAKFTLSSTPATGMPAAAVDSRSTAGFAAWVGKPSTITGTGVAVADPVPKLTMAMNAAPARPVLGETLAYNVQIANNGRAEAQSIAFRNRLPSRLQFVAATADQGSCVSKGVTIRCGLGTLGAGESTGITISAVTRGFGNVANRASLSWKNAGAKAA